MSTRDPFELLRSLNPLATLDEALPADDQLLATITASTPAQTTRRHRRRGWIVGGTAGVVLAVAAFAVFHQSSPKDPTALACYSEASRNPAARTGLGLSPDPVAACAEAWRRGALGDKKVPEQLTACISDVGTLTVIPGDQEVCSRLGFDNWVGSFSDYELMLSDLQDELSNRISLTCHSREEAFTIAAEIMNEYHLRDWTLVDNNNWSTERSCSTIGVDPVEKSIHLGGRHPSKHETPPTT